MSDEYNGMISSEYSYQYDYKKIITKIESNIDEYDFFKISNSLGNQIGIHPFDLFIFQKYVEENGITKILELGSGTSSKFMDLLGLNRTTFALKCEMGFDIPFTKIDILKGYETIKDTIKGDSFDMFFIDSEHSNKMAKLIDKEFFKLVDYKTPIFFHDWFDNGKRAYQEQLYYLKNIMGNFDVTYMTDLPIDYIKPLTNRNPQLNETGMVPKCSVILTPK